MKKIKYLLYVLIICLFGTISVKAASISVKTNATTVAVGNTIKVTVTVNNTGQSAGKVGAWEYCISYDSSKLTLTSGTTCVLDGTVGLTSASTTFTFKAIASGSSKVTVKNYLLSDYDTEMPMSTTAGSVTIKSRTQAEIEASYSTNANLKELAITDYQLTPAFDKNTTDYTLEVPNEVENITISASKEDSKSTVTGDGTKELTEGLNRFEIVVTAEKGNKKTYVIEVTRKELNPIMVNVDGEELAIIRKADAIEVPSYYTLGEITIDGENVPALKSDITGYTLLALKNEVGDIHLYVYDDKNNSYTIYNQLGMEEFTFIPLSTTTPLKNYSNIKKININDVEIDSYIGEEDNGIVLVYGMNAKTGEVNWYKYDSKENTFQRYIDGEDSNKNSDLYFILAITFISISLLTIILLIIIMATNSKIRKKNDKLIEMLKATRNDTKKEVKEEVKNQTKENESKQTSAKVKVKDEIDIYQLPPKDLRKLAKQADPSKKLKDEEDEEEKVEEVAKVEEVQEEVKHKKTSTKKTKKEKK